MSFVMQLKEEQFKQCKEDGMCGKSIQPAYYTPCINGKAGEYECSNVDLLRLVSFKELGSSGEGNDIWGWTDPQTGKEYAIAGCSDGTSFVDVTNPTNPKVVGFLRTHSCSSIWRDIKVCPSMKYLLVTQVMIPRCGLIYILYHDFIYFIGITSYNQFYCHKLWCTLI